MDWLTVSILAISIFLGYFLQTIVGFAASLVALPILITRFSLQEATAILSVYYVIFSAVLVIKNWKEIDKRIVGELAVGIIAGMILGVALLKITDSAILKRLLGAFIIIFVLYTIARKQRFHLDKRLGLVFGLLSGIIGGLFSSGGPFIVAYLHSRFDSARVIRSTVIGCLAINNFTRVPLLLYSGMYTSTALYAALIGLPFFAASVFLGQWMFSRIDENLLKRILLVVLSISGISLLLT